VSTRRKHSVSGTVSFQIGFLPPKGATDTEDALKKLRRIYSVFADNAGVGEGLVGVLGVPAVHFRPRCTHNKLTPQTEGIGTVKLRRDSGAPAARKKSRSPFAMLRSSAHVAVSPIAAGHKTEPITAEPDDIDDDDDDEDDLADDGLSSSSDEEYEDAQDEHDFRDSPLDVDGLNDQLYSTTIGIPGPKPSDAPKTAGLAVPPTKRTPSRQSSLPTRGEGYFDMPTHKGSSDSATLSLSDTPGYTPAVTPGGRKNIFKRSKPKQPRPKKSKRGFNFNADSGKEVLGIVIMEIKGAEDLPKLKSCKRMMRD
jgi:phosphatidylserine decarboxylase